MKTYDDLAERVRRSNPTPADSGLPNAMWDAATLLEVIDRRGASRGKLQLGSGDGQPHRLQPAPASGWRRWQGPLLAAGAAAVVILIAAATALLVDWREPADVTDTPSPTTAVEAPTTAATTAPTVTTPTTTTTTTTMVPLGMAFDIAVTSVDDGIAPSGTFLASGPAVEAGILCRAGTMTVTDEVIERGWEMVESWKENFVCDDGSGGFTVDVRGNFRTGTVVYWFSGEWTAVEGSGAYAGLTGNATIEVSCSNPAEPRCHEDHAGHVRLTDPDSPASPSRNEPR